jgi:malonyl-CoA O-methyltransferase
MSSSIRALKIVETFDDAASRYDAGAAIQARIANELIDIAASAQSTDVTNILDIGCGTGLVAHAASNIWPYASFSAIDGSYAMIKEALKKLPHITATYQDIATFKPHAAYDLIVSSMALHWVSSPEAVLRNWAKGLNPKGNMFVACLAEGSFHEWKTHCARHDVRDGVWKFPADSFADHLASSVRVENIAMEFPSALEFLRHLKTIGAATADSAYRPIKTGVLRRLLESARMPFIATYRVVYVTMASSENI